MTDKLNGTYSMVTAAIAGCSIATVVMRDGSLEGNDIAGSRYRGSYAENGPDSFVFTLEMTSAPGSHGIFGTSPAETFQTRTLAYTVPAAVFTDGEIFVAKDYGVTFLVRRIPDEYALLAGPQGIEHMLQGLAATQKRWAASGLER